MKTSVITATALIFLYTTCMAESSKRAELSRAISSGDLEQIQKLFTTDPTLAKADNTDRSPPPLHQAARLGRRDIAELLIRNGVDVNAKRWGWAFATHNYTALHVAAAAGQKEVAELLIEKGADVNARNLEDEAYRGDNWAMTPLHSAVDGGNIAIVKALIAAKAKPDEPNYGGLRPLYYAASGGKADIVALLLENKVAVDAKTRKTIWCPLDHTALHIAARNGHTDVVKMLLSHKADATAKDGDGKTPLDEARDRKHADIVKLLEDAQK
jgi:ankyrin repeat protein